MKTRSRFLIVSLILLPLMLGLASAAFADETVNLLPEFVGATNPGFEDQSPECAANAAGQYQWVFALVWIDEGTSPGVLTATFENAGTIVNSSPTLFGNGNMQRWWVFTTSPDKLLSASATVPEAQSGDPRAPGLKLSSIRSDCTPPEVLASTDVSLGACAFEATSETPATIDVSPSGGAVVTLKDFEGNVVATTSNGATVPLGPGTYSWSAEAATGYTIEGPSSGTVTAGACAPGKPPTEVLPRKLPETGLPGGLGVLAIFGFGFVLSGVLMVAAARRPAALKAAGVTALIVVGTAIVASFPLALLPVVLLTPWRSATNGDAASWVAHAAFMRPVMAVSRGGIWRPALG
jgi:hypothetical protein